MGNRAVITTKENFENNGIGVYVHWNGGYDSVSAFLKYCELKGYSSPDSDNYGWARLCQVIGNFFGGTLFIGIDTVDKLNCNGDNGVYIIEGWKIVGRENYGYSEQMNYELEEMLIEIDESMPVKERMGEYLEAVEIYVDELNVGDVVFIDRYDGKFEKHKVMGFGADKMVNGTKVHGKPYVDLYCNDGVYDKNINNFIHTETVRVAEFAKA